MDSFGRRMGLVQDHTLQWVLSIRAAERSGVFARAYKLHHVENWPIAGMSWESNHKWSGTLAFFAGPSHQMSSDNAVNDFENSREVLILGIPSRFPRRRQRTYRKIDGMWTFVISRGMGYQVWKKKYNPTPDGGMRTFLSGIT
jgi:hypothetical protein